MRKAIIIGLLAMLSSVAQAQTGISPVLQVVHANKHGKASGTFSVSNGSLVPIVSVLEIHSFAIDAEGNVTVQPLAAGNSVVLGSSSVRVPPQSSAVIDFHAVCPASCEFFIISSAAPETKTTQGIKVRIVIPETVYIATAPVQKSDITTKWTDSQTLVVTNTGAGFDRPALDAVLDGKSTVMPSVPLMPGATRIIHFKSVPSKVVLQGDHFKIQTAPVS